MAGSINTVCIGGNLVRDAELRRTSAGMPVLNYCVAVSDRRRNPESGCWEDAPCFVDCAQFGRGVERLASRLRKGSKVVVDGRLNQREWLGADGTPRRRLSVVVGQISFQSKFPKL